MVDHWLTISKIIEHAAFHGEHADGQAGRPCLTGIGPGFEAQRQRDVVARRVHALRWFRTQNGGGSYYLIVVRRVIYVCFTVCQMLLHFLSKKCQTQIHLY